MNVLVSGAGICAARVEEATWTTSDRLPATGQTGALAPSMKKWAAAVFNYSSQPAVFRKSYAGKYSLSETRQEKPGFLMRPAPPRARIAVPDSPAGAPAEPRAAPARSCQAHQNA